MRALGKSSRATDKVRKGNRLAVTGSLGEKVYTKEVNGQKVESRRHFVKVFGFDVLTPKSDDQTEQREESAENQEEEEEQLDAE